MRIPDVRQSLLYARFMDGLGWRVEGLQGTNVFIRKFSVFGAFIKIQRSEFPVPFSQILFLKKKYRAFKVQLAPNEKPDLRLEQNLYQHGYLRDPSPNIPTMTIEINLNRKKEAIFSSFESAKRRSIRKAIRSGIKVEQEKDPEIFFRLRKKQFGPLGFLLHTEMKMLTKHFFPQHAAFLIGYKDEIPVSGIMLLFYRSRAYYWYATATAAGKHYSAPSLLVWEAIKLSKKRKCTNFDFEGVFDSRFPKINDAWKGFSKFKSGFGGEFSPYVGSFLLNPKSTN